MVWEKNLGPVEPGGQGGKCISVYPIPTEGSGLSHHITSTCPFRFSDLQLALKLTSAQVSGGAGNVREFEKEE